MTVEKRNATSRALAMTVAALAATIAGAESPTPSWGTAPSPQQALPASSRQPAAAGLHRAPSAAAAQPETPLPGEGDCAKLVQKPPTIYFGNGAWSSSGDYNSAGAMTAEHGELRENHYDLEMRIEQLRCETKNIKEKLNYLIRRLP